VVCYYCYWNHLNIGISSLVYRKVYLASIQWNLYLTPSQIKVLKQYQKISSQFWICHFRRLWKVSKNLWGTWFITIGLLILFAMIDVLVSTVRYVQCWYSTLSTWEQAKIAAVNSTLRHISVWLDNYMYMFCISYILLHCTKWLMHSSKLANRSKLPMCHYKLLHFHMRIWAVSFCIMC